MKRKGLMRRVLASILCATLVFQNVSVTAYATETAEPVTEISTEEASEETSEEKASEEKASEEKVSETEASKPAESEVIVVTDEEADAEKEEEVSAQETTTVSESVEEVLEESVEANETEAVAEVFAEIKINEDSLKSTATNTTYKFGYDVDTKTIVAEYTEEENVFGGLLGVIKTDGDILFVTEDGAINAELKNNLSYKWQSKKEDGTYADMASDAVPSAIGEYKLVISLDQKFGKSEAAEINFEIKKAVVTVDVSGFAASKNSGTTVKEIKDDLIKNIKVKNKTGNLDWDTYVKAYTITVRETKGTEALADDFVLKKGNDYSVDVVAELADTFTAGYELKQANVIYLKIENLKKTKLEIITSVIENEKDITRVYDGKPVAAPTMTASADGTAAEVTVKVTVDGETDETTGEDKVLDVTDKLTETWYDADKNALEGAPTNAGVYYFELKYTDTEGIYAESMSAVKVVVEPKTVVLKPSTDVTEFFVGNTAKDVTSNVVYTLVNTDDSELKDWNKETFWGVSYNNPDRPQSYAPVFKLQMGTTLKPEEGKTAETVWTDVTDEITVPTGTDEEGTKTEYRIVFAGTKGLYNDGDVTESVKANDTSVNSADKNHAVDISKETIEKNAIAVTVNKSANATIDTTAMLVQGLAEESFGDSIKVYSKIYDGTSFYADRAAYKKAVVKDAGGNVIKNSAGNDVKDTASELTYTWYYLNIKEYKDEDGNLKYEANPYYDMYVWTEYNSLPNDAGLYALEVSYNDPAHKYVAQNAYVYFEIDRQLIKVIPEGTPEVYAGTSISNYTNNIGNSIPFKVYQIPGNDVTLANDKLVEMPELGSEYWAADDNDRLYDINWFVLKGDNIDKTVAEYTEVTNENFVLEVPYKLGVRLGFIEDPYYDNYTNNYEVVVEGNTITKNTCDTLDITVKPEAETEISITFDESKLTSDMLEKVYDGNPIDISAAIANGFVKVTNVKTGEEIPVTGENAIQLVYEWKYDYYGDGQYYKYTETTVNAYKYKLTVTHLGDDKYKAASSPCNQIFEIKPRKLTITPVVCENIYAGWDMFYSSNSVLDHSKTIIEGFIPDDAAAFDYTDSINDAIAINRYSVEVTDEKGNNISDQYDNNNKYLRTGRTYRVGFENVYLNEDKLKDKLAQNYELVLNYAKFQPNRREYVNISSTEYSPIKKTEGRVYNGEFSGEIKPVEGIAYYKNTSIKDVNKKVLEPGNYFVFNIKRPTEFYAESGYTIKKNAVYKNSIEKAGGYVLSDGSEYIKVAFEASAPETGDNTRVFDVIWEEGYTVNITVNFKEAELEADLTTAVVPKSLAFNAVDGKMIVGENQQLDVKITKALIDDVICLNYAVVTGEDIVSVTNTGYMTALKSGTATVEVYPVKHDVNGNEIRLDYKAVTAKITVSDVTAPKTGNIYAYDDYAEVTYTKAADGYRREIYVLEGKGLKPDEFETKIAAMNQGIFEGIVYSNINVDESVYDANKKLVKTTVSDLKPNTDYTVYVRNVSGIRTNAKDELVVLSKAGSVKSFKTTKVQLDSLKLFFDENQPVEFNKKTNREEVALSSKTVKISACGDFAYKPENVAADSTDRSELVFPLTNQQQDTYVDPKLTYYAVQSINTYNKKYGSNTLQIGSKYYVPSTIAKADNKGNIKLTGTGYVYIIAYDSISKKTSPAYTLFVTSPVNKITAKKITVNVGEPVNIWKYLTFYAGKTKLSDINDDNFAITLQTVKGYGVWTSDDGKIYASQDKQSAVIRVALADNPAVCTDVNVTTKALNPIKNLKVSDIMDNSAMLTFTHSVDKSDRLVDYKLEIRNGRNELISSRLIGVNVVSRDEAKRVFTYSYKLTGLTRLSEYRINITPVVYGDITAKPTAAKFKTTDIPAYRGNLLGKGQYSSGNGRMQITYLPSDIFKDSDDSYMDGYSIENGYFTSGKSYTFLAEGVRPDDIRPTDTLTWKSSNTKVATIKANPGTYTATFNAVAPGLTDIEVTSKLRKGVIARYKVLVKAVGAAGDKEFADFEVYDFDPYYTKGVEVLTEKNPVRVTTYDYDYTWVKFTAPADGEYTFKANGETWHTYYKYVPDEKVKYQSYENDWDDGITLNEGETVYIKFYGSFAMTVTGNKYSKLTTKNTVNSKDSSVVVFTAPEDNYYTFSATSASKSATYKLNKQTNSYDIIFNTGKDDTNGKIKLNKGDKVTFTLSDTSNSYDISVSLRAVTAAITTTAVDTGEIKAGEEKWFVFKADVAGKYEFNLTEATAGIKASFYKGGISSTSSEEFTEIIEQPAASDEVVATADSKKYVYEVSLNKDETVAVKVWFEEAQSADSENPAPTSGTAKISVSMPTVDTVVLGTEKEITVAKKSETWVSFVVDEDSAKYFFNVTGENVTAVYYNNSVTDDSIIELTKNAYNQAKKGDVIYIKLNNSSDAEAKAKVLVSKASATQIKLGEVKELTVENDGKYYYSFKAPAYGLYAFKSDVTVNAEGDTHNIVAKKCDDINSYVDPYEWANANPYDTKNFYKEVVLTAGAEVVFVVEPTNTAKNKEEKPATTAAKLSVSQVTATELLAEITLPKDSAGDVKWYRFTAKTDDTYTINTELNGLADAYYALALSTAYDSIPGSLNLSAGQSIYFRVVSRNADKDNDAKIKITVTGTESLIEEIPTAAFEVKGGETKTYKYTVTKAGRYKVNFKSNTENVTADIESNCKGYYDTVTNNEEFVFDTVGKTYYFKVTTNNADAEKKASITLNVTEVTATAITAETTPVTVKANDSQWLVYTVPAAGRYEFKATAGENEDLYTNIKYYDDILSTSASYNKSEEWLNREELIYIKLDNSTDKDAIVKFTVKAIQAEAITAGTEKEIALKKGESKWYKFTADETTYYTFKQSAEDGMSIKVSYNLNTAKTDTVLDNEKCLYIQKNDNYYIKVTRTDASDAETLKAKLTIKKETVHILEAGKELTVKAKSGERKYLKFTAPKSAYYAIGYKNVAEGVTLSNISNYSVVKLNVAGEKAFYPDVYFDTTEETKDTEKEFTIYVEEVAPKALALGSEAEITVAKYQKAWYTFEAPADGIYNFAAESTNEEVRYQIYNNGVYSNNPSSYTMPYEEVIMAKGDKLTMAVYYNNNKADKASEKVANSASFKLKVTTTETKPMTSNETAVELGAKSEAWYTFTASEAGRYTFSLVENKQEETPAPAQEGEKAEPEMLIYTLDSDKALSSNSLFIDKGESIYLLLKNSNDEKLNLKLKCNPAETVTLSYGKEAEVSFTKENVENKITEKWVAFTAPKTSNYYFKATNLNVTYGENSSSLNAVRYLEKGNTVYLRVKNNTDAEAKTVVTVTDLEDKSEMIYDSKNLSLMPYEYKYYTFVAPSDDRYIFNFFSDQYYTYCSIYDEYWDELYYDYSDTLYESLYLNEGQKVYVCVGNNKGKPDLNCAISIEGFSKSCETLYCDEEKSAYIESSNEYFYFVAPEDGFYLISTYSNSYDGIVAVLYNKNWDQLGSFEGSEGSVGAYIQKGQRVYYSLYSSDNGTNVYINVNNITNEIPSIVDNKWINLEDCNYVYYKFTAPQTGYYSFYSSDSNGDPYCKVYHGSYVYYEDDSNDYNFDFEYYLNQGQTVYFRFGDYESKSYKVNVEFTGTSYDSSLMK